MIALAYSQKDTLLLLVRCHVVRLAIGAFL